MIRFIANCCSKKHNTQVHNNSLSVQELSHTTRYWIKVAQNKSWTSEINALKKGLRLKQTSRILSIPLLTNLGSYVWVDVKRMQGSHLTLVTPSYFH